MNPSRPGQDHERWADSVGAYLLEALPDHERQGFEGHLAHCGVCLEDVEGLRFASDALPASVEQLMPPPELKDRIMAVVEADARLLAAASGERADLPEEAPAPRRRRFALPSLRPAFALATVVGLLVLGGLGGALIRGGGDEGRDVRTVVAEVARGDASAKLLVGERDSRLEVANLDAPPEGRVYQVWLLRPGGKPEPTRSLFVPRADGTGSVSVPGSLEGVQQVLVTDEPVGGSKAPTKTPFLSASLRRS
jgi:anti-sigma-K factor RskA